MLGFGRLMSCWQAARSVGSVGRCRKSQQLVNANLIRELLRPLRPFGCLHLCATCLHTASLHRCIAVGCGVSNGATSSIANKQAVQQQTPRSAAMRTQCAAPGRLPLPSRHVPETARASRHLTIARGLSRRASNKWRTHRHEAASVRQARCNRCRAGSGLRRDSQPVAVAV